MGEILKNLREKHIIGKDTREQILTRDSCPALHRCDISVVGITQADAAYAFVRLQPNMWQILITIGGAGRVAVGGQWRDAPPGHAYLTPAGATHAYHTAAGAGWQFVWMQYPARTAALGALDQPMLFETDPVPFERVCHGLAYETHHRPQGELTDVWVGLLNQYLSRLLTEKPQDMRLLQVWEAVQQDLRRPWTLGQMAALACTSKQHFHRLCLEAYGLSPVRQLTRLRLRRARDLLRYTADSIAAVALQVGYSDAYAFSTAFKRDSGLSPSAFRRQ